VNPWGASDVTVSAGCDLQKNGRYREARVRSMGTKLLGDIRAAAADIEISTTAN
jgi:hypothetical protein